jgi:hypothetical protein
MKAAKLLAVGTASLVPTLPGDEAGSGRGIAVLDDRPSARL